MLFILFTQSFDFCPRDHRNLDPQKLNSLTNNAVQLKQNLPFSSITVYFGGTLFTK